MRLMITLVLALSVVLANKVVFDKVRNSVYGDEIQGVINALELVPEGGYFPYEFREYLGHDDYGFLFKVLTRGDSFKFIQVLYTFNDPAFEFEKSLKKALSQSNPSTFQMTHYQFFKQNLASPSEEEKPGWLIVLFFDDLPRRLEIKLDSNPEESVKSFMNYITKIFELFKKVSMDSNVSFQKFSLADLFLVPSPTKDTEDPQIKLLVPQVDPETLCNFVACFIKPSKKNLMSLSDIETTIYEFVQANNQSLKNACPTNGEMQSQIINPIRDQFEQLRESEPSLFSSVSTLSVESDSFDAAPGIASEQEFAEEFSSNEYTKLENILKHNRMLI